jgi:short-subunit dehydrogenase
LFVIREWGKKNMELSGKLAIVTGASREIGRALDIELAKSGNKFLLTAFFKDLFWRLPDAK